MNRREVINSLTGLSITSSIPRIWTTPAIAAITLPTHAQTSNPSNAESISFTKSRSVKDFGDLFDLSFPKFIPSNDHTLIAVEIILTHDFTASTTFRNSRASEVSFKTVFSATTRLFIGRGNGNDPELRNRIEVDRNLSPFTERVYTAALFDSNTTRLSADLEIFIGNDEFEATLSTGGFPGGISGDDGPRIIHNTSSGDARVEIKYIFVLV